MILSMSKMILTNRENTYKYSKLDVLINSHATRNILVH